MAVSACKKCGAVIFNDFSRDGGWYFLDDQWRVWKCRNGEEHEPNIREISTAQKAFVWIMAVLHGIAGLVFRFVAGMFANHLLVVERWLVIMSAFTVWLTWMHKLAKWVDEQLDAKLAANRVER